MKPETANGATLIYIHIPKSGGVTLEHLLSSQFNPSNIYKIQPPNYRKEARRFVELPSSRKRSIELLTGHMAFGIHEEMSNTSSYFTMLRNPIDRIISYYYFVKNAKSHPLNSLVSERDLTLEGLMKSGATAEMENGQTRMLAGMPGLEWFGNQQNLCPSEALDMAKFNIDKYFPVAGVTECYDQTLHMINATYDLEISLDYKQFNVTKRRPLVREIPKKILRLIEDYNEYDLELYEKVRARFISQATEVGLHCSANSPIRQTGKLATRLLSS